jgi:hypothetical protein
VTSATRWGLPDWHDASAYPGPDDLSLDGWRWEFTRRRADYRADWKRAAAATYRQHVEHGIRTFPRDHPQFKAEMPGCVDKYGLPWLANPRLRAVNVSGLTALTDGTSGGEGYVWFTAAPYELLDFSVPPPMGKHLVYVVFDLDRSVQQQIETAKELLLLRQGVYCDRRVRRDKWSSYLRALDARQAGATYRIIGQVILRVEDYDDAAKRGQEIVEQAQAVQENFPA